MSADAAAAEPVVVIGGGAVGLAIAEALTNRGTETIVVERGRCGGGASAGNAGWITPSLAIPVPGPGVIGESLRWLVNPSGPLWIRPSLSPAMLGWIARFVRGCSRTAYRRGLVALQGAGTLAGPAFDRLAERGVEFELHDEPLLYPAFEQDEFEHLLRVADELAQVGGHAPRRLSAAETVSVEPALGDGVVGGLIADGDSRVRPESLTAGLQRALEARGVQVRESEPVTALTPDRGRWVVQTSKGSLAAGAVILASAWTPRLRRWARGFRLSPQRATAARTDRTRAGRSARSTWRLRRLRSVRTTAAYGYRGRWSSAHRASHCRREGSRRSRRVRSGRCQVGGCHPTPRTGPGCDRCRPMACP